MNRYFVIQEHDADRAGLHWDIRFEDDGSLEGYLDKRDQETNEPYTSGENKVLRSFVIPKHRFPCSGEKLLCIEVEPHPWEYREFDGEIESGYGKGTVKLLFSDYIEVPIFTDNKIEFVFEGNTYKIFLMKEDKYLITMN
jgi:hypothetical protein